MQAKGRSYFLLALLIGSAVVAFLVLQPFLTTIALASVFAVVLTPLYERISRSFGTHPNLAAFATMGIGILLLAIPLFIFGSIVIDQSKSAYNSVISGEAVAAVQQVALNIGANLEPYAPGSTEYARSISLELNSYFQGSLTWLISRIGVAFTSILAIFLRALILLMALYYFLKDGKKIRSLLIERSPLAGEESTAIAHTLARTVTSIVKGSLVIALIQGMLAGIGYLIFGIPNPALWGVATSFAALIPGFGTSLVIVPAVLYLLLIGKTGSAIGLLLWGSLLVGLIDNFLAPRLMGRGAQLHPLAILLSVLGGVILYGPAGLFLGPLTISFLFAVYTVYAKQASTA